MLFVIYELAVFIMLINMLIASMERTYEQIAETQKEWKRQVNFPQGRLKKLAPKVHMTTNLENSCF